MALPNKAMRYVIIISIICYSISWFLPAFEFGKDSLPGWTCAIEGLLLGGTIGHFEAYSNLFYLCIFPLIWRNTYQKRAMALTTIALLLSSQTFTLKYIPSDGGPSYITNYGIGFYLWFFSFLLLFIVSVWQFLTVLSEKGVIQSNTD